MTSTSTHLSARIYRFDPTVDTAPRYDAIEVPRDPHMRVLDVLEYAVDHCGLGLGYRYFCGVKRCGLCGVKVNGKPVLACWEEATPDMLIEPLDNMPVIRDLTVDRSRFEQATIDLEPRLVRDAPYPGFPERVTHVEMGPSFRLMNCIECYVCSSACPAVPPATADAGPLAGSGGFVGPGTLVQLAKVALHPKDGMARAASLENADIEQCMSCFRCEQVCPVSIPIVTGAIMPLRSIATTGPAGTARFPVTFADNVKKNADVHSATLFMKSHSFAELLAALPMVLRMLVRRKVRLFPKASQAARQAIQSLFKASAKGAAR